MDIGNLKKQIFKISLVFIVLLSLFTCVYSIQHYSSSNTMGQNVQFNIQGVNNTADINVPEGMPPSKGRTDLNGNMTMPNENGQPREGKSNEQEKNGERQNNKGMQPGKFGDNIQKGAGNTKYLFGLSIYSIVFLILCFGLYYLFRRKKLEFDLKNEKILIMTLLLVGFLLRISASTLMDGYSGDINLFKNWAMTAANGLSTFYSSARQADYPPLYIYVLGLVGKIANTTMLNSYYVLLLKIPPITADVITSFIIYKLAKKYLNSVISIFLAAFYIFNPAVFIDSTFWGQVDSFFTLLIFIAIYLLHEKKYAFSSAMFAVSILMKPQGIIFLPILFFELVRQRKIKNFIFSALAALVTILVIIIPFSINQQNPLWIVNLYTKTISEYPYASVNAFNFFSLIGGNYKSYNTNLFLVNYHTLGMLFIVITTLIGWFVYIKGNNRKYVSAIALLQIAGVFTFSVGMHERYLFPAVALAVLSYIYLKDKRFMILAIGFSITSYINISTILFNLKASIFNNLMGITSILNIVLVAYLLKVLLDNVVDKFSLKYKRIENEAI
jgi:Gpi18-like mannosyltransferase